MIAETITVVLDKEQYDTIILYLDGIRWSLWIATGAVTLMAGFLLGRG